jgi:hypothetical protein
MHLVAGSVARAQVQVERRGRRLGDQIDRAADRVRTIERGRESLRDLHLGDVVGKEAVHVDIAVIRHVDRNAVNVHRHLADVEAADEDASLVSRPDALDGDSGNQIQRVGDSL